MATDLNKWATPHGGVVTVDSDTRTVTVDGGTKPDMLQAVLESMFDSGVYVGPQVDELAGLTASYDNELSVRLAVRDAIRVVY